MKRRVFSFVLALALCLNLCPTWVFAADGDTGGSSPDATRDMFSDDSVETTFPVSGYTVFKTNGYTYTCTGTGDNSAAFVVTSTGKLELKGAGKIISENGVGIDVQSGGTLLISEDGVSVIGKTYAIYIAAGATVKLRPGTYSGETAAIYADSGVDLSTLLPEGHAFFDDNGHPISPEDLTNTKTLTVSECTNHAKGDYRPVSGTPTHSWVCAACNKSGTDPCTFDFVQDGAGTCGLCQNKITVAVDRGSLEDLAYDDTVRPENGAVTVTVKNAAGPLTEDTDFTLSYQTRANVGDASFTVTVTVIGKSYTGTFTQDYKFTQDELKEPVLKWENNSVAPVPYTGGPVTKDQLPGVTINITTASGVDLHDQLRYSHRAEGTAAYTDGLPTNAGTYDVVVTLPEGEDYQAASSEPIKLIIEKIDPIETAPAAAELYFNRNPQALVTAGTLKPVAIADGLKIQFATEENGPWFDAIPTATDAGEYHVWYQVTGLTDNYYIEPTQNPAEIDGVEIQRKSITPVVTLSQYSYQYDNEDKQPAVTVKDPDGDVVLSDAEYAVSYENNRNVSTDANPAKVVVTDKIANGGNYDITRVEVEFKITSKTQDALSITNKPSSFTYGDQFTLGTSGGSGNGLVTWKIVPTDPDNPTAVAATVDENSGQVTITGHGSATVQATKSGKDPDTGVVNYNDAIATWTFTADKKPVTATVTAEDKTYNGNTTATVHAVVESGVLSGDEIKIEGLTGTFDNENAGVDKTVTVVTTGASITGTNSEHYEVTYSATTVKATINKAIAKITTPPGAATLTYDGTAQALIATDPVVDPTSVLVEYALSEAGPYNIAFPIGTNAGTYTVWYRVKETDNYTGLAPESIPVTINKKPVNPTIVLDEDEFIYDGTAKEPGVTLYEADGTTVIPIGEYTVTYSDNLNVGTATVTVTAKADGNYAFTPANVTANFTIKEEQAEVLIAPEAAGLPLYYNTFAQKLVTAGTASGGDMVYSVDGENGPYSETIPTKTDAGVYTVHYKVQGDDNHSDSDVASVSVTIAPKTVKDPTIELFNADDTPLVSYTYDDTAKKPKVKVIDGSDIIGPGEYNIVYSDNINAGDGKVSITDKPGGNYTVTGSATFVINKANIVFDPAPKAAENLAYNGMAQQLLVAGATTGGTVLYALNSETAAYYDYIPTATEAGNYTVYYKVTGDRNHNDLPVQEAISVTIGRKALTAVTIELTPDSFYYDGAVHLPTVTVKDGDTVLPASEYTWTCNAEKPTEGGTYTVTVSDKDGGNYNLTGVTANTATFTIGKAQQAELVIEGKPSVTNYGDTFKLTTSGGSGDGAVTWTVAEGPATVVESTGDVTITGVGEVTITAKKAEDTNYEAAQAQLTFTATAKPVTAEVTVADKVYDGTRNGTVNTVTIPAINGDAVEIDPTSITATFDTPNVGTGKTVTLNAYKAKVTGNEDGKYAISYPDTVAGKITKATTTITKNPVKIDSLTYNGQPQALITAGETNVGFLEYALNAGGPWSTEVPTGTNAGDYTVYYKVEDTTDYSGVAVASIDVTIGAKDITPTIELSESSYVYDGAKKSPKVTLKDGDTVIPESQYTVTWAGTKSQTDADLLRIVDTYTATIKNVAGGNYTIDVTAAVEITPAEQAAITITGKPEHVYYGDTITTLGITGGTGEGTVKWSVTAGNTYATIEEGTGKLTITGVGAVTVRAERSVPNYGAVGDNWNFTVEPKPVTAEVTVADKVYDGTTATGAITAQVKAADLVTVNGTTDTVTLSGLTGVYTDANVGTGKTVTLSGGTVGGDDAAKYTVTIPTTATGAITPRRLDSVTVTLSGNDLKTENGTYYYDYDGTDKTPSVTVKATDNDALLMTSDYSVSYAGNKNVGEATVTVTAKAGGNYTFTAETVNFEIRKAAAMLTSSPQAKDLTYEKGTEQELVTVGAATGGTVKYKLSTAADSDPNVEAGYGKAIPKAENAGTYTVYYKVEGDDNHNGTTPGQVSVTIKPKQITAAITLSGDGLTETGGAYSCEYSGIAKTPDVTVKDGNDEVFDTEYSVSYRDNINAGTATVTVSDANGGNYIVNGTATFEITKKAPTVTDPEAKTNLQYTGEAQDLVSAGVCHEGTVLYSVNGGNYTSDIPTASAVGTYTIAWMVKGDANHSDTAPATLTVAIAKNKVNNPTITLSQDQFTYNENPQRPEITVRDDKSRLIPEHEYTVTITGTNGNTGMVTVDTYTVTVTTPDTSDYIINTNNTRIYTIKKAGQEAISITGAPAQVYYGDTIQLGASGGAGSGTTTWTVTDNSGSAVNSTISSTGLLTVKDVGGPMTVTVKRSAGGNYTEVSATWEFSAAKKPVTADVTVAAKNWDGTNSVPAEKITVTVPTINGDKVTITGLTGTYDTSNVGTGKTVTLTGGMVDEATGTNADKYDVTIPATTTGSILAVAATVDTVPGDVTPALTYDAAQSQELVTAGSVTGGTMVYSLDGNNFSPNIPKGKDAGTYTVYYKAQGDQNHTDSEAKTVPVTIHKQTVTPSIELTPPSAQYDGNVKRPEAVIVRDTAHNVIPASEYTVVYDSTTNWKDVGKHKVKVQNVAGGNYDITEAEAEFEISTKAQNPLTILDKPGLVYYGDSFTLSATGGSGNGAVTWSSSDEGIAFVDENGLVTIKGTGPATITATKAGGGNYDTATATYPLNALKKAITAIVTADDREYKAGDTSATIHVTWEKDALVKGDNIDTSLLSGMFDTENVGTDKTVTITGTVGGDDAGKYDITIPATTTASIFKATVTAPTLTGKDRTYDSTTQALVDGGNSGTRYSDAMNGVYSEIVPTGTNAGSYTVWYKQLGDDNHSDSEPQAVQVTISPKTLTTDDADVTVELSPASFEYDGTAKKPDVVVKDGAKVIPPSEYTVSYSDNVEVGTTATVTLTDNEGGNYAVSGTATFEIRKGSVQLVRSPQPRNLTYTGQAQELVTVGTATGGHFEYAVNGGAYSADVPKETPAGTYTVRYKVVGDANHEGDLAEGSVTVTIKPKEVVSPEITVNDGPFIYTGSAHEPTVTIKDGGNTILTDEYTLSYQNNTNAGTATVFVTDKNGGDYTVNGTATFEIGKATAAVGTAPTGKTGLKYNGTAQELLDTLGTATGGTMVYSLTQDSGYSAAIPTGKAVGEYEIWYKVLGDSNHSDSTATALSPKVKIDKNTVTNPTIQVTPASAKYTGEKQEPTITVKDDNGLLIDGSEYTVAYLDENGNNDLTKVGTYKLTINGATNGNYTFDATDGKNTATFTITQADQTPLNITGTREQVRYGDTIPLGTTGGVSGGKVTWTVDNSSAASINATTGLLTITGVGSVTVTATSKKDGYADQTATWKLYAEKKPVTAVVTAASKDYDGSDTATVTATLQGSDFVGTDSFTITLTGCTFEDANAGTDKKVKVVSTSPSFTVSTNPGSTDNHENYAISYPVTTTASIFKADIAVGDVAAPEAAEHLVYTGNPQALVTAGSSTQGTLEYSLDDLTYSASLPTGTDAGDYDVWYRVKGDGNHNDTNGTKLGTVTITPQTVAADKLTIEFTPNEASYNGQVQKPSVTVKDGNGRVIPETEYTVEYSETGWTAVSTETVKHIVTVTDNKTDGNYVITQKEQEFKILPAGQDPLSIVNQPGTVRYGTNFTLSVTGGTGAGTVSWSSDKPEIATIDQNGLVKVNKAGGPVKITATRTAAGHTTATATWSFSAEKKPVTAIVTAEDKVYNGEAKANLVITWSPGDVPSTDATQLSNGLSAVLTGTFNNANAGDNKTVTITHSGDLPDGGGKYEVSYNQTTKASITPATATVTAPMPLNLEYSGNLQTLVSVGTATHGTITYSLDGIVYGPKLPQGKNADSYTVWYKVTGDENYKDIAPAVVPVTIQPKTVNSPNIELTPNTFEYDGTAKEPAVTVKDGNTLIPASEYTVDYSSNINVGTNATVTISDAAGGNYTVSGTAKFTIKAGAAEVKDAPQAINRTYDGTSQPLVTAGTAVNGKMVYSDTPNGSYSTTIPSKTDAGTYTVWYKAEGDGGETAPHSVTVTIQRKQISPRVILIDDSVTYTGKPCEPGVALVLGDTGVISSADYDVYYANHTNVGTAMAIVVAKDTSNYSFTVIANFEIVKDAAKFTTNPTAIENLKYSGTAQKLIKAGEVEGGTAVYSLNGVNYSAQIPAATDRGNYTIYAKVQGDDTHSDSAVVEIPVKINVNTLSTGDLTVALSTNSFPYTGSEVKPTVTVTDKTSGRVIPATEYDVTYSDNVAVTNAAKVTVQANGNYKFGPITTNFSIVDANQTPLTINGKKDTVYYGDTLQLTASGGPETGNVTWSSSDTNIANIDANGTIQKVATSGSVTITATKGSSTVTWTFYAQPKPVTAVVTAANKPYDGTTNATLTVSLSGLLPGESVTTVTAEGHFTDSDVGTNKTVTITKLTIPADVGAKYAISQSGATTASITPAPAAVTAAPTLVTSSLTYNGAAQALLTNGGTAASGGNLMYSVGGDSYSYQLPTAMDAGSYTVWYKVVASDDNHKDSAAVKLGDVTIAPNVDTPTVLCTPATIQYDGTEKTPTVVVRDSAQRIIPESEYTVTFEPGTRIAVGKYKVTVTDKPGGNYQFSTVTKEDAFEIVSASQNPLSIVTDIPTDVHYGDTFRLSAMGGSGSGAIQWSVEGNESGTPATITATGNSCVVTVTGTGGFTVEAYRTASDGYSQSNTDSVPFVAKPKPVTPVVTASDKSYDGSTDAALTATWKNGDLVNGDTITVTATGAFDMADVGANKRVSVIGSAVGTDDTLAKYAITWPDSTTASIYKVDAKLETAPGKVDLTYNKTAQALITSGATVGGIGTIEYSTSQNGVYSTDIPTGTNAGTYTVWYRVEDSVNYTGIAATAIEVEIKKADPGIDTKPTATGTAGQELSDIQLNGGVTSASGKFAWEKPETVAVAGTAYNVIFTPDDTANYETVTFPLTPVSASSSAPVIPSNPDTPDSTNLATTVRDGTATSVLSTTGGDQLVQMAVENQSERIVIQPEVTGEVTKTEVTIPASTVSRINSQTEAALTVASPIADVTIPNGALDTLGRAGGTLNVVTEQVDDGVALTLTAGGKTVDSVPGGVTLAVPAEDAAPGTVAVLVNEDGTRQTIQKSVVKDGVLNVPLDGSATVEIVDNSKDFDDVAPTDWAADAVAFASAHELFGGTSNTSFSPDEEMSRGMLATVLHRLEGLPNQDAATLFEDVDSEAWYTDGITWAAENGIVSGYGDGQFGPNDSITREQFAVMLWRYAGCPETGGDQALTFTDADQASGYAVEALRWAVANGVMGGYPDGRLAPGGTATRAQAAQMLKNFMEHT